MTLPSSLGAWEMTAVWLCKGAIHPCAGAGGWMGQEDQLWMGIICGVHSIIFSLEM